MNRMFKQRHALTVALDDRLAQRKLLYFATYFAGMIAIQIMHLAMDDLHLNLQLSLGITAGFAYSYFLAQRWRGVTTYAISGLAVLVSVYYLLQLQRNPDLYGNYLGILLGVLMVLLAFKAFSPGDHRFILMVCVIFLLFSSVASYDLKFMLLLPLFLISAGCALYIAHQIEIALRVSAVDPDHPTPDFKLGFDFVSVLLRAVLGIIILSVVAYIFTPHSSSQNRRLVLNTAPQVDQEDTERSDEEQQPPQGQQPPGDAEIGLGDDMDLTDTRELSEDPRPVLLLKSHLSGYLRAKVYDVYTGSGWVESPSLDGRGMKGSGLVPLQEITSGLPPVSYKVPLFDFPSVEAATALTKRGIMIADNNVFSDNHVDDVEYDIIRQEIKLLESHPPFYLAMYQPYQLSNVSQTRQGTPVDEPLENPAGIIRPMAADVQHPKDFSYTMLSLVPRAGSTQLKQVFSYGPQEIIQHYTQLPTSASPSATELAALNIDPQSYRQISQRLRNFANTITAEAEQAVGPDGTVSVWDKVQAIYDYLLDPENLTYTRQFKGTEGQQEICETFLFNTREGYCRHFATAMAVLCRLKGVPTRLVTGYAPGSFSLADNGYIYRASNAHTWVEVYFDGYGWITYDPTPAGQAAQNRKEATQWLSQAINFLQDLFVIDPAGTQQTIIAALKQLWALAKEHGLTTGLTACGIILVIVLIYLLRNLPRSRQRCRLIPENEVVAGYVAICRDLGRLGFIQASAETPRRFLLRAADEYAVLSDPLHELAPALDLAAYSRTGPDSASRATAQAAVLAVAAYVRQELQTRRKRK